MATKSQIAKSKRKPNLEPELFGVVLGAAGAEDISASSACAGFASGKWQIKARYPESKRAVGK